jgi:type IV pilus assembly protein PilV
MKTRNFHPQAGLTLIEVLVAILIFSFGLLGFVGLQARAIQYSVSAEDSNRASLLANEVGALMMLNGTSATKLTDAQVSAWQARVSTPASGGLPGGEGVIALNTPASGVARITLTWQSTGAASSAAKNKYVTEVSVP